MYSSPAWGKTDQPDFVNQVLAVQWAGSPEALMHTLQTIEQQMGRVRSTRWGPRTIDIDILSFGDVQLDTPSLQLPHPQLAQRAFVLVPWASIASMYVVPGLGRSVGQLLAMLPAAEVAAIKVLR